MLIPARVSIVRAASRVAWYAALSLLAAPTATRAAAEPGKKPWTVDDVLRVRDLTEPQVSPDGRWVVFVVSEADDGENAYNTDLYLLPADGAGTGRAVEATRLTRSPKPDHRPRWSPDGRTIAFLSGRESAGGSGGGGEAAAGDEKGEQVWLIRPDGGEPWQPAALEGSVSDFAWSPDGTLLALLVREPKSEERVKREKDKDDALVVDADIRRDQVFVMEARTGVAVQVTRGSVHFTDLDWAPEGRRLAVAGQPTPKVPDGFRSDIYTLDLTAALRALREQAGRREQKAGGPQPALAEPVSLVTTKGEDGHPRFSPDGTTLVFLTQDGSEEWFTNQYVATAPAAGGAPRVLTRAFDEEAENPRFTADGKAIVFEGQARLAHHLFSVPVGGGEIRRLTSGDAVHREGSWSRDGRIAALVRESPTGPPEISILETAPKRGAAAIRPLSRLMNGRAISPRSPRSRSAGRGRTASISRGS